MAKNNKAMIEKELSKWQERVFYDISFKENTEANLEKLRDILFKSFEKFTMIAANSEPLVYKIGRFFISEGTKNSDISFIDGKIIESYIGNHNLEWKKKDSMEEFFEIFGEDFKNKWVFIPLMQFEITPALAINFILRFKKTNAIGVVFYAEGPNNLTEVLVNNVSLSGFYQFPKADYYSKRKRKLPEDKW